MCYHGKQRGQAPYGPALCGAPPMKRVRTLTGQRPRLLPGGGTRRACAAAGHCPADAAARSGGQPRMIPKIHRLAVTVCPLFSLSTTLPKCAWTPSSTRPTSPCSAEAAWTGASTARRGRSCWQNAGRSAAVRRARPKSAARTACRANMSSTPSAPCGTAAGTASGKSLPPVTAQALRWPSPTAARRWPFR